MEIKCIDCKEREIVDKKLCSVCLVKKYGLPWMGKMKVANSMQGEIGYILLGRKEYLVVSGTGGMLFTREEAERAGERFRGERALIK